MLNGRVYAQQCETDSSTQQHDTRCSTHRLALGLLGVVVDLGVGVLHVDVPLL
jgi:hypothetical protein